MADRTKISLLTEETAPDADTVIPGTLPTGGSRRIKAKNLRKLPLGEAIQVKTGSNATAGSGTLVSGTLVISTTKVTANSLIFVFPQETGTLTGILKVSARTAGTSFTVSSSVGTDTVKFAWMIVEPY